MRSIRSGISCCIVQRTASRLCVGLPSLTRVELNERLFVSATSWCIFSGSSCSESRIDVGALNNHPSLPHHWPKANVRCMEDLLERCLLARQIVIDSGCLNDKSITELEIGRFPFLRTLAFGYRCCTHVTKLTVHILIELERVTIGSSSFSLGSSSRNKKAEFCVTQCPKLKVLKIGRLAFMEYSECILGSLPSLEEIEMGKLNAAGDCYVFQFASLKLLGKGLDTPID